LNKIKKFVTCQVDVMTVTMWCGSVSATCHYYAKCHSLILNLK